MVVKAIVNQKQFQGRIERNCLKDALAVWLRVIGGRGMLWSVASELMGDSDKHITFFSVLSATNCECRKCNPKTR